LAIRPKRISCPSFSLAGGAKVAFASAGSLSFEEHHGFLIRELSEEGTG